MTMLTVLYSLLLGASFAEESPEESPAKPSIQIEETQSFAQSRYLYNSAPIAMEAGQYYFAQMPLYSSLGIALTDHLLLSTGSLPFLPILLSSVGARYHVDINNELRINIGAEGFSIPALGLAEELPLFPIGVGYASASFGDETEHYTLGGGISRQKFYLEESIGTVLIASGYKELSERYALVSENWINISQTALREERFPISFAVYSVAVRIMGKRDKEYFLLRKYLSAKEYPRHSWDLGFFGLYFSQNYTLFDPVTESTHSSKFTNNQFSPPIPWLNYTLYFGPANSH